MTAAELFAATLRRRGIDWMATLCGHGLDPLYQAAKAAGLRLVDTRNEQTAAFMADAYGRLTRTPGVCATSSGVAFINALSGAANASFDCGPMLLLSGAGALRTAGLGHFQDLDQVAIARPVTKYSRLIDVAERAGQILEEALDYAAAAPQGPVHITFPMDIQTTAVDPETAVRRVPQAAPARADNLEEAAALIAASQRPLLAAGSGVFYAGQSGALMEFSERMSIPVVVPIWDRGCIERPMATFMGVLGAATGGPRLLADTDCLILAGAVSDYRTGFLQREVPTVFLEGGWDRLASLAGPKEAHRAWLSEAQRRRRDFIAAIEKRGVEQAAGGGTHAIHVVAALRRVIDEETVLLIDGGSIGQWAHQLLADCYPSRWLTCGRSGVVGWGIGGAMTARLAKPENPVILLSGDGAFTFNVADLECAVRQKLPFAAIVADDCAWGITRAGHLSQFGEPIASALGPIDFARLAESLGAKAAVAKRPEEIEPALRSAIDSGEVTVIHVPIIGGNPA